MAYNHSVLFHGYVVLIGSIACGHKLLEANFQCMYLFFFSVVECLEGAVSTTKRDP